MPVKSILRKEGVEYTKKSLSFIPDLEAAEPARLSEPKSLSGIAANDLEQENFRQVWREISSKKLHNAARTLQKFARKNMLCWILVNERRTNLYEELDYIDERLRGDLERLEWEREDMQQEADLQIQAERENGPPGEHSQVKDDIITIKSLQSEIRAIKADNAQIKLDVKKLKRENKQLGYDLKEKAPAVEMSKCKVENLEKNHVKIQKNHDQYLPNMKAWQDSLNQTNDQLNKCQSQGHQYRDACLLIYHEVKLRYRKKKLADAVLQTLRSNFAQYFPLPENEEDIIVPPKLTTRHSTGGKCEKGSPKRERNKLQKSKTDTEVMLKQKSMAKREKEAQGTDDPLKRNSLLDEVFEAMSKADTEEPSESTAAPVEETLQFSNGGGNAVNWWEVSCPEASNGEANRTEDPKNRQSKNSKHKKKGKDRNPSGEDHTEATERDDDDAEPSLTIEPKLEALEPEAEAIKSGA